MKISVIQMNSQADKAKNIEDASHLIKAAASEDKPDLVVLPENFAHIGGTAATRRANAETFPEGTAYRAMSRLAAELKVSIHAGSMLEAAGEKCYNATVVFNREGDEIARYRKIHLFDVEAPGGVCYRESDTIKAGRESVVYKLEDLKIGCAICYDLRFPELFRTLRDRGAELIVLPAAFTLQTGRDHWEPLLRARAIETQSYLVASAQIFAHDNGARECFGRSLVIDPWGAIIAQCPDRIGHISAVIDKGYIAQIRRSMPVADHRVTV
ncbi:MAG: carbon-nitrogen hydrolase family protein [Hyphomicrobiales bacterium]